MGMLATASGAYDLPNTVFSYTYDGVGNRATSDYDGPSTATSFTYNYESGKNRFDHVNTYPTYTNDALGNVVEISEGASTVFELSYTLSNQLFTVTLNGTGLLYNIYDHQGQRIVSLGDLTHPKLFNYDLAGRMISEAHLTDSSPTTPDDAVLDYVYLGNHRVAVLTGTINPGPGVGCFVATAAYGTAMSVDIQALRELRDNLLNKISLGRGFIEWYYLNGPRYARWLQSNPVWKSPVRWGLRIPVGMTLVGFYGHAIVWVPLVSLGVLGFTYIGRKRGWKKLLIASGAFFIAFGIIIVYSFFVHVPEARATRPNTELVPGGAYFIYEDHIGRPVLMSQYEDTDGNGNYLTTGTGQNEHYFWKASYKPFGQVQDDFDSVGITVGTGNNEIHWLPPFRFPGQYEDPELNGYIEMFYNHYRFYVLGLGRYSNSDPLDFQDGISPYNYSFNNPSTFIDPKGLYFTPTHGLLVGQLAKCNKYALIKGAMRPDTDCDKSPKRGKCEGACKRYWHFSSPDDVHTDLDVFLDIFAKNGCDPIFYGMQIHRLMDSYSHYMRWWPAVPPQRLKHPSRPSDVHWPTTADSFNPDPNSNSWSQIDYQMYIDLISYMDTYNQMCCSK